MHFAGIAFKKKLKFCHNLKSSKSVGAVFPTASADFISVSHFGHCHNIYKFFFIIIFFMVICDQLSLMILLCLVRAQMTVSIYIVFFFLVLLHI